MIPRINERTSAAQRPLGEALARPVSTLEGLTGHTVVAHWAGLDFTLDDEQVVWASAQWAEHLDDPLVEHPFTTSPLGDRRAIVHIDVRLPPGDRALTGPEWAEVGHRLARAAGIEIPGDERGCRWIAVQAQPRRLDLIANLIRLDGTWSPQPVDLAPRLAGEARRIETDLRLTPVHGTCERQTVRAVPTATAQMAAILSQLADEQSGPLATVRGLVEHTAHRIAQQPGDTCQALAHRLELIAQRLHHIQHDLNSTTTDLPEAAAPRVASTPPAARHSARRAP
ncbi:relaxase/mobilization nuclease [Streptomyces sp. NPDC056149]|uniref:relaxase/mobilization nuclease n=1 Tax=Streptomyces sp. NPDC056149 TaxID=3345728 RepID=UPI0035DC9146